MKFSVYRNAVLFAFSLGFLGLLVGCYEISVSFEPKNPETSASLPTDTSQLHSQDANPEKAMSSNVSSPEKLVNTVVENTSKDVTNNVMASRQNSDSKEVNQGTLRMSNQTDQPVRLAMMARRSLPKSSKVGQANYDIPAHWDFDPQEGSAKGLMLSLPKGNLKLVKGDILVAFAQDGSRRYWGPYVVGETPSPSWNSQTKEWQLILSP